MGCERLVRAEKKVAGRKETLRALEDNRLQTLFIARDADDHIVRDLKYLAREKDVNIVEVDSMKELGGACGLDVGAAAAGTLA